MAELLPLKFRILHYFSKTKGEISVEDLLRDLKDDYGTDGQFNKGMLSLHMDSLRAVGMIESTDVAFDKAGELLVKYKITEYGLGRLSYLPSCLEKLENNQD